MKKKTAIIISLLLCVFAAVPVYADGDVQYIFDEIEKIGSKSEVKYNEKAERILEENGVIVSYVLIDDPGEDTIDYAESFYKENFGKQDGILLVETDKEWYIHLAGKTVDEFDRDDRNAMWEGCGNAEMYNEGAEAYINKAEELLDQKGIKAEEPVATEVPEIVKDDHPLRVVDNADILTAEEEQELLAELNSISNEQLCDVSVVIVNTIGDKTPQAFVDDYYDYNGYGMGEKDDGIMFMLSMDERKWAISTHEFAITAFTDAGQEYITDQMVPYLSDGEYAEALDIYADLCDDFIYQARNGEPYDVDNLPDGLSALHYLVWFIPSLAAGAGVSVFLKKNKRKSLKNVRFRPDAAQYLNEMKLTRQYDQFLSRRITVIKVSDDDSKGGSSIHVGSSGRTHGGSSGSF